MKHQMYWTTQLSIALLLHLEGQDGYQEDQEPDWRVTPYVFIPGIPTTRKAGMMGLWESTSEKLYDEEPLGIPEDSQTREKRQTNPPVKEVEFRVKTVENLGKVLEIARRPLKTSIHGLTHTLDLSLFAEREKELGKSTQIFLNAKRMTDATVTDRFSPAGEGQDELRFWPPMSYETCKMTCTSHDASIIHDYKAWKDASETTTSLSAWIEVEQSQEDLVVNEERLPSFPITIATWGGKPLEEQCQVASAYVSALGEVGLILPSHANRTSFVEAQGTGIQIFNSRDGESITDLMWSRDPKDKLETHYYSRYPNQHEGERIDKHPEQPRIGLIIRPMEYRVWANASGCYAVLNQVTSWALKNQQCICQRAPQEISKRDRENLAMRRDQNRLIQNSLHSFVDPIDKRKITHFPEGGRAARETREQHLYLERKIPKLDQAFDRRTWKYLQLQLEQNDTRLARFKRSWGLAWSAGYELASIIGKFADKKIRNLNPEKLVDTAVHYMTNLMFGTKPIKKKRIPPEVLLTPSPLPKVAKRLGLEAQHGILTAIPRESIAKHKTHLLMTDSTAEQALKATGPAVIELDEAKALRDEFYKYELIPSLPKKRIQELERMGEEIVDATAVIYDTAPGKSGMYLVYATERRDHNVKPEYSYIPLPENMNPENHQRQFPELTLRCREVLLDQATLTEEDYEDKCPPKSISMNGHTEHLFPKDKFSIQRFISPHETVLNVACPMTGHVREICKGVCALRLGDECTLQYRGATSFDGTVPPKADQTYDRVKKGTLGQTYEMLSNEKTLELPRWKSTDVIFWLIVAIFIIMGILVAGALIWFIILTILKRHVKTSRRRRPNRGSLLGFGNGKMIRTNPPLDEEDYENYPSDYDEKTVPTPKFIIKGNQPPETERKVGLTCHLNVD